MISFQSNLGIGDLLWSLLWFTLFVVWIILLIRVFADIFRSPDLSGIGKVLWTLFVMITPYLGVFSYVIIRGRKMVENDVRIAAEREEMFRAYVRSAAGPSDPATELERLAALRKDGTIDDTEFAALKAKIVGS